MKCPMFKTYKQTPGELSQAEWRECLKEECAWWTSEVEACSMVALVLDIGSLAEILATIMNKMPHEKQFRR